MVRSATADVAASASVEFRLRPPPLQPGVVRRTALVDRLLGARESQVVTIVAPAGYGKTTLATQWCESELRPSAWLAVDRDDNDPVILIQHVVAALRHAGMLDDTAAMRTRVFAEAQLSEAAGSLAEFLRARSTTGVLMLDEVNNIRSRAAGDVIAELAVRLPRTVQLVLTSRTAVRLPSALLRARAALLEVTASDLAMGETEARELLGHLGVDVGGQLGELVEHTEGWPVGLYLIGLAVKSGSFRRSAVQVEGSDRFVAEYLNDVVLERLSEARAAFLIRTSILERLCGPLCDAVLGATGSDRVIERLDRSNLLIMPLDRTGDWYRYHHLLREFLAAELARREPQLIPELHLRAATWFEAHDLPTEAIMHAQAANDADRVAHLIARVGRRTYALGQADTVLGWLRWFEHQDRIIDYPDIAALGALIHALSGNEAATERWASVLLAGAPLGEGGGLSAAALVLRGIRARDGIDQMRADAHAASRGGAPEPEWRAAALALEGFSHLWEGNAERAEPLFGQAAAVGDWFLAVPSASLALAALALIAIGRDDWAAATEFAARAEKVLRTHGLERYLTSALTYAIASRCAIRRHDITGARRLLARAAIIRPQLTAATPALSVQILLEMASAHTELSDDAGARVVLRQTATILARRLDLGRLPDQFQEIKARLDTLAVSQIGLTALTAAELRLLPYLATHLSFAEIAERLYVSRHTVKTQAMSIYRKVGASSRSEAVRSAVEAGLLND